MTRRLAALLVAIALAAFALRVYRLDDVPPGFYIDESSVGANAWSVAVTGHDLAGVDHPVLFRALEDWKHPIGVYAVVASVRVLGPTPFAVRLPAAVFGALAVALLGLVALELSSDPRVAVASAVVLAVTPWHVHFSRLGWGGPEVYTAPILLALWLYFVARRTRRTALFDLAGAAFGLALYTYAPAKLVVPAFLAALAGLELHDARWVHAIRDRVRAQAARSPDAARGLGPWEPPVPDFGVTRPQALRLAATFALVAAPLVWMHVVHFREIQTRFDAVSVFRQPQPAIAVLRSFGAHFGFDFLFVSGDANPRHAWHGWGELLLVTAPFCALGLWRLVRRRATGDLFTLLWLLVFPLGACLTAEGIPHASRALMGAPLGALLAAHGLALLLDGLKSAAGRMTLAALALALVLANAGLALRDFFLVYPYAAASAWNEGAAPLIASLEARRGSITKVHLAQGTGLVRDDVLFFSHFDPVRFDSAHPDPYYEWVPSGVSVGRLIGSMKRDEVLVERIENQLGVTPEELFPDRTGMRGFAVYRGTQK